MTSLQQYDQEQSLDEFIDEFNADLSEGLTLAIAASAEPTKKKGSRKVAARAKTRATSRLADLSRLAEMIRVQHIAALNSVTRAVQFAVNAGELLLKAKEHCPHGTFMAWIEDNCLFKYSTAARYMKAAQQKSTNVEFRTLSELFPSGQPMETLGVAEDTICPDSAGKVPMVRVATTGSKTLKVAVIENPVADHPIDDKPVTVACTQIEDVVDAEIVGGPEDSGTPRHDEQKVEITDEAVERAREVFESMPTENAVDAIVAMIRYLSITDRVIAKLEGPQ